MFHTALHFEVFRLVIKMSQKNKSLVVLTTMVNPLINNPVVINTLSAYPTKWSKTLKQFFANS